MFLKKLFILLPVIFVSFTSTDVIAKGKCRLTACSGEKKGNSVLSDSGQRGAISGQCYNCNFGDNAFECPEGTVIGIRDAADANNPNRVSSLWYCSDARGHNDEWINYNPGANNICQDSDVQGRYDTRTMTRYIYVKTDGSDSGRKTGASRDDSGDNIIWSEGATGCWMVSCKSGYTLSKDRTSCVQAIEKSQEQIDCENAKSRGEPANWNGTVCNCGSINSQSYTWDASKKKCVLLENPEPQPNPGPEPQPNPDPDPQPNPDPTPDPVVKKSCRDSRTSLEGKACCDLPSAVAKWIGGACVCQTPDTEFRIEQGRGVCANKTSPVVKAQCNCSGNITIISNATAACGNGNSAVSDAIAKINAECNRGENCDANVFEWNINIINNATATCAAQQNQQRQDAESATLKRINNAVDAIDRYVGGLDVSVWKNADGEFNTARLASDSVAGVVLGTVGGIITSNVVKKNQLKTGFEDIVCTINGQEVGSYGDEIIVGIQ